jgi:dTDP-L-rhamnose 4-epimerase
MRDYVNVHDVVDAHLAVLENPAADGEVFNMGRGEPTRVHELAAVIAKEAGTPPEIHTPGLYRIGATRHSLSDVSKLKKLGWTPKRTIANGVREYIGWIRQFPEAKKFLEETLRAMKQEKLLR